MQQLAAIPAYGTRTPQEAQSEQMQYQYRVVGTELTPDWAQAIEIARTRTREANGLQGDSSVQLQPNAGGKIAEDSPIAHLQRDAGGVERIVATTSTQDILRAREEVLARMQVPTPDSAEQHIAQASAQQRGGQEQAQREANRQGLSQDDTQVAMRAAASAMSALGGGSRKVDNEDRDLLDQTPPKQPASKQEGQSIPVVPPDFAPSQQGSRDLRDPQHEGHYALREMQQRARVFETQNGIAHGPHSDRLGASMLAFAVENGLRYDAVSLEKSRGTGQVQLRYAPYREPERRFPADLASLSSQSIEATSQRIDMAVSRHNGRSAPALARTPEQAQALGAYSLEDKAMFARVRGGTPGLSDDHVAAAVLYAKKDGMDANSISQVSMVGDQIRIAKAGPGESSVRADVQTQAQPLQESIQQASTLNQQREQQLAMEALQREQQQSQGRGFTA